MSLNLKLILDILELQTKSKVQKFLGGDLKKEFGKLWYRWFICIYVAVLKSL